MSDAPLFRTHGLVKRFGGVLAVDHISFAITDRTVFAIIGPNGAGKSTLLNLLSGIYAPDGGSMELAGTPLVGLPAHRRVRLHRSPRLEPVPAGRLWCP